MKFQPKVTTNLFSAVGLAVALFAAPCFGDSQVRIVRLSQVEGDVSIDRNTGQGFERAILNLPVTQGVKIKSAANGRAEIETEDGSTIRIIPNTTIEFPQLTLRDSGAKVSTVNIVEGTAYVRFAGAKDDELNLTFVREKIALAQSAHLRIQVGDTDAVVGVLKGEVEIKGASGEVTVAKEHKATFDLADQDKFKVARDFSEEPFDTWDKQQDQYRDRYASNAYSSYSPYAYGTSDLNYYGSFSNVPGYGTMWQPYFTGAGWDPFMNGAWAFSPGIGYGWVSGYPWGWTPYHYGSWMYVPTNGWMWQPGGAWMGLNTMPVYVNAPPTFIAPRSPVIESPRTVPVNNGPRVTQVGNSPSRVQIPTNSAGLGIGRGSVMNLSQLSQTVQQKGFVDARMHTVNVGNMAWGRNEYGYSGYRGHTYGGSSVSSVGTSHSISAGHAGSTGHR